MANKSRIFNFFWLTTKAIKELLSDSRAYLYQDYTWMNMSQSGNAFESYKSTNQFYFFFFVLDNKKKNCYKKKWIDFLFQTHR